MRDATVTQCPDAQHLSSDDKRFMRSLRIEPWTCPTCGT